MLVGYNTNITHKGMTYHVQTEDSGPKNPVIITLLYQRGAILASKKTSYANLLEDADLKQKIEALMKNQHKGMIKELTSGRYTGTQEAQAEDEPEQVGASLRQPERSLDDILIDFIIGKEKTAR
ncbi:MAG: hypothetical protein Q8J64_07075 [Thermodesulfovibrionales bacterium]|nr:hypothetical protein [Thermodesulfovibrionales bacterium]